MTLDMRPSAPRPISAEALERARRLRDLSDPVQGRHALQLVLDRIVGVLAGTWQSRTILHREDPVVSVHDNYDALHYPAEAVARDARYTRYVTPTTVLRTHSSAMIPRALRRLAQRGPIRRDVLLVCPGLVYRRDAIDRLHTGEPHQCDLWRVVQGKLTTGDLERMIALVVNAMAAGSEYRTVPVRHPYTTDGLQIDVYVRGEWVEIGECGLALPAVLEEAGLPARWYGGLAMGIGLDRLLMLVKGIDDIRLLRSEDPRIAAQMLDLSPYRPVSDKPPLRRDLSVAVAEDTTAEEIGDRVREALGDGAGALEAVEVLSETPMPSLPPAAAARIGMCAGQKNVLLRIVIRDLARTLTAEEGNALRDRVYAALHQGTEWQWAAREAHGPLARRTPGGE